MNAKSKNSETRVEKQPDGHEGKRRNASHLRMFSGSMLDINEKIGISKIRKFVRQRMGNYVILKIHWQRNKPVTRHLIEEAIRFCVANQIYFTISEFLSRYDGTPWSALSSLTREDWIHFRKLGGEFYFSDLTVCERGGIVYWPLQYKHDGMLLPKAERVDEARKFYVDSLRKIVETEHSFDRRNLVCIDSSMLHKYHLEAGVSSVGLEVFPGNCNRMFPAVRGAARGLGDGRFGADLAMLWYGGVQKDALWFKRWKLALYYTYLAGAEWLVSEAGDFGIWQVLGKTHPGNSTVCRQYRKILRDFYTFTQENPRPGNGPETRLALIHGRDDGCAGLWNREVWGQYQDEKWLESCPEESWSLAECLLRKCDWFDSSRTGGRDYSGNPPLGQFDILPAEAPLKTMRRYTCIIFMGWNTMDAETYGKLRDYVENGGHLIMTLGHLSTQTDRAKDLQLFNQGDFSDLFGLRISGPPRHVRHAGIKVIADSTLPGYHYPNWTDKCDPKWMDISIPCAEVDLAGARVLAEVSGIFAPYQTGKKTAPSQIPAFTEHRLGKGTASLVTLWGYPGTPGIRDFYKEILQCASLGEMDHSLKVCAPDRVRYAVYGKGKQRCVFLLNTDMDLNSEVIIISKGHEMTVTLPPVSMHKINLHP